MLKKKTTALSLYLEGGIRAVTNSSLSTSIRRTAQFVVKERAKGKIAFSRRKNVYCAKIKTTLGRTVEVNFQPHSASDLFKRAEKLRKSDLNKYSYSRGIALPSGSSPKAEQRVKPAEDSTLQWCAVTRPSYVFGDGHFDWGDLYQMGETFARRFGDIRFVDRAFAKKIKARKRPEGQDASAEELLRKKEVAIGLRYVRKNNAPLYHDFKQPPLYSAYDPLGTHLVRVLPLRTKLSPFAQDHFIFQSRPVLHLLRIEALGVLETIRRRFYNSAKRCVGHLSVAEFDKIFRKASELDTAIDYELFLAWHPSQHGAVPLLLKHFDADLLLRALSSSARDLLSEESQMIQKFAYGQLQYRAIDNNSGDFRRSLEMEVFRLPLHEYLERTRLKDRYGDWDKKKLRDALDLHIDQKKFLQIEKAVKELPEPYQDSLLRRLYNEGANALSKKLKSPEITPPPGVKPLLSQRQMKMGRDIVNRRIFPYWRKREGLDQVIRDEAYRLGAIAHRQMLENARFFQESRLGMPIPIMAVAVDDLHLRLSTLTTNREISLPGNREKKRQKAKDRRKKKLGKVKQENEPIIPKKPVIEVFTEMASDEIPNAEAELWALKTALVTHSITPKSIRQLQDALARHNDVTLQAIAANIAESDKLPARKYRNASEQKHYWQLKTALYKLRKKIQHEIGNHTASEGENRRDDAKFVRERLSHRVIEPDH